MTELWEWANESIYKPLTAHCDAVLVAFLQCALCDGMEIRKKIRKNFDTENIEFDLSSISDLLVFNSMSDFVFAK